MSHSPENIKQIWHQKYADAPKTLAQMSKIDTLAAAFNVNVDSIIKISGKDLSEKIKEYGLSLAELQNTDYKKISSAKDIYRGIFRCFSLGIAEEWVAEDKAVYDWMKQHLGTKKLQMGAQAGIIANTLSLSGIQKVVTHTASLPELQAEQFFKRENLLSFDENGNLKPAYRINRPQDQASIHWIIEFDKDDKAEVEGTEIICPKSNRFIATYDPMLFNLVIDDNFVKYTNENPVNCIILSGYQALSSANNGVALVEKTIPIIKKWKQKPEHPLIHLEIASTQDKEVRKAVVEKIVPLCDSCGLNERETIDLLEVLGYKDLAEKCNRETTPSNLWQALKILKQETGCPRIQLHMFGLYMTAADKDFCLSAKDNLKGMILAATAAASKASIGKLSEPSDIPASVGQDINHIGINALNELAEAVGNQQLLTDGFCETEDFTLIAVPTIIINKPKTLVGMGDTISAFSLLGAL